MGQEFNLSKHKFILYIDMFCIQTEYDYLFFSINKPSKNKYLKSLILAWFLQ